MNQIQIQKGSKFYCFICQKMVEGSGFLVNTKTKGMQPHCEQCYKFMFPKFKGEQK